MIEIEGLRKHYRRAGRLEVVLHDIHLTVKTGEILGIIGSSGAGKSTLLRCMNLLETVDTGVVRLAGQDLCQLTHASLRHWRRKVGMIFQHFNLLGSRSVADNILLPLRLSHLKPSRAEQKKRLLDLLDLVEMGGHVSHYPHQLSGGQRQRVAIARALVGKPSILLCDEPTSALDTKSTELILELLARIRTQFGITIVLVTHALDTVKSICDRIVVLDHGKIAELAQSSSFFSHPQSDAGKALIRSASRETLPLHIQRRLCENGLEGAHLILRICFRGEVAKKPIIAQAIRQFGLLINIHMAKVESIQKVSFGTMLVEVYGHSKDFNQLILFLKEHHIDVEQLGYVPASVV